MAHPVLMISILVIVGAVYLDSQRAEATSILTENEENDALTMKESDLGNSLKTLKRTPRSKLVFEIVINLGKKNKRKKGRKSLRGKRRKSSKRRNKNRRIQQRTYRRKHNSKVQRKRLGRVSRKKKNDRRRHRNHYHEIRSRNKKKNRRRNKKKSNKKKQKSNKLVRHGNHYHRNVPKRGKENEAIRRYFKNILQKKKPRCRGNNHRSVTARSRKSRRNKGNLQNRRQPC